MPVKTLTFLICFFALFNNAIAQTDQLLPGHKAPAVIFQDYLGKKVTPDFYHDKILVLDFWATWCAPCIGGFPHFNALTEKFQSKDIIFAAITDENKTTVERFFKRTQKQLKAYKLIDTTKQTQKSYNIEYIPHCVVIGRDNVIKWEGQTGDLTEEIIAKIAKNEVLLPVVEQQAPAKPIDKPIDEPLADRALFSFIVAKSDTTKLNQGGGTFTNTFNGEIIGFKTSNESMADFLETITGYSKSTRIITNNDKKLNQLIDINYRFGHDTTLFKGYSNTILKNAPVKNFTLYLLGSAFRFNAKIVAERKKHYELIVTDSAKLHSFLSMQSGKVTHNSLDNSNIKNVIIIRYNLNDIATKVENFTNNIITTDIRDKGLYDVSLDISNMATLNKSLNFHGLGIKEATDDVELLSINFY